jgi:hypothetical protein
MAHWGVAYALGPFYNLAWRELGEREAAAAIGLACDHIARARALATHATGKRLHQPIFKARIPFPPRNTIAGTTITPTSGVTPAEGLKLSQCRFTRVVKLHHRIHKLATALAQMIRQRVAVTAVAISLPHG